MPTREPIANTIIPQTAPPPIQVRTVTTRAVAKPTIDQQVTNKEVPVADSTQPSKEESVTLTKELSAKARSEQAFRQRERALKDKEAALEAKLKDAEAYQTLKTKLTAKDYAEAEALGLNYEEYTKYKVDKLNGEDPKEQKIRELEQKIEALAKGTEESAQAAYDDTVKEYKKEISSLVASTPEFSSLKGKYEEHVLQNILDSWEQDDEEVTIAQAAKETLEYLKTQKEELDLLFKKPEEKLSVEEKILPAPRTGLKTLTQQLTVDSEKRPLKPLQYLSESERYAEARRRVLERRQKG
jgi:hypothetical protein